MADLKLSRETLRDSPKVVSISLSGEIDQSNGRQAEAYFDETIQQDDPQHVLLDLTDLGFAGSGFYSSLLFWKEELVKRGGTLRLYGAQMPVLSTMRMLSLDRMLTVHDNRDAALSAVPESS